MEKKVLATLTGISAVGATALPVLATESSGTANSAVTSAMQTTANDMIATGTAVIPIALTVVGLALVVVFGVRLFKKVAK